MKKGWPITNTVIKRVSTSMLSPLIALMALLFLATLMGGCASTSSHTNEVSQDSEMKLPYEVDRDDYELVLPTSSHFAIWNAQDYVEYAQLIVIGTVTGAETPILIQPKDGELEQSRYFTDYTVQIDKVLFNAAYNSGNDDADMQDITIRTDSGAGTKVLCIYEFEPELKIGETYLFFLENESDRSVYKTGNDYYVLSTRAGGAWDIPKDGVYVCKNEIDDLTVDAATLEELIVQYGGNKINEDEINEGEENQQKFVVMLNGRGGAEELPIDSYLKYVDEREKLHSSWATILPKEMHSEFEELMLGQDIVPVVN